MHKRGSEDDVLFIYTGTIDIRSIIKSLDIASFQLQNSIFPQSLLLVMHFQYQ